MPRADRSRHLLLSLPLCMLSGGLAAQTTLNATDLATLRAHIATANANGGDYVINVAAGSYVLNGAAGDANPASGDLDITKTNGNLTIAGAGVATTFIDANNIDRAFHVSVGAGVSVTFQNLSIRNGRAVDNGSAGTEARGGGIYAQSSGAITLTNVAFDSCRAMGANGANGAMGASGGAGSPARGGAIYLTGGTLNISGCMFNLSAALGGSGGIGGVGQANASQNTTTSGYVQVWGGAGGNGGAGALGQGGAIYIGGGSVTIATTTIGVSQAHGGVGGAGGIGGAANYNGAATASANAGAGGAGGAGGNGQGGGVFLAAGTLNVSASTFNANEAIGGNGGVGARGGHGNYNGSWIGVGNGGQGGQGGQGGNCRGGAIYFAAGTNTVVNSTLSANTGTGGNGGNGGQGGNGGGTGLIVFQAGGSGGNGGDSGAPQGAGIYVAGGGATVNNSTVVLQTLAQGTAGSGGAVGGGTISTATPGVAGSVQASQGGGAFVTGGSLNITSTIFANNTGPTALNGPDISGPVTANNSLIKVTTGATITGTANVTGVDPNLGALANNGGPTQTHALPTGSPAIDAGANPGALTTDQRGTGFLRQSGAATDIGAFENQSGGGSAPTPPTVTDPAAQLVINANSYNIQGTAQANVLVRIYNDANANGALDAGDSLVSSQQLTGGGTNFSVSTPLNQNATNRFLATAFNGTLESAAVVVPFIVEDSQAPNMVVITDPASAISIVAANYTIQGTAEANSLVRIYRDLNSNGVLDAGEPVVGSLQLSAGNTAFAISAPLIAASVNRFLATATDAASNESTPVSVPAITETSTPPTNPPTITTPASAVSVNSPSFNIVGTAQPNALVRIYRDFNNDGVINGPDVVVGQQQLVSAGVDFTITVPLIQNAANDFLATAEVTGQTESAPTNVPTITDNAGFSSGGGPGGGGGGGGCETGTERGFTALLAALAALLVAVSRWFSPRSSTGEQAGQR